MASEAGICNEGLQLVGAKRISSLTDDSVNARACNACYESVRDALYEEYDWSFTITRTSLAADATEPEFGKAASFTLPADYIGLISDYPERNTNDVDFEIEGKKIYTNQSAPLEIRYKYRVTDPNEMTPLFRRTLSCAVAVQVCEELTQSNSKKEDAQAELKLAIAKAKKANAFMKIASQPPTDSWITVRS